MPTPQSLIPRRAITRRAWPFPSVLASRWERCGAEVGATTPDGAATTTSPSTTTATGRTSTTLTVATVHRISLPGATAIGSTTPSTAAELLTATEARPTSSVVRHGATRWPIGRPTQGRTRPGSNPPAGWGIAAPVRARVIGTWLTAELDPVPVPGTTVVRAAWAEAAEAATVWAIGKSPTPRAQPTGARSADRA